VVEGPFPAANDVLPNPTIDGLPELTVVPAKEDGGCHPDGADLIEKVGLNEELCRSGGARRPSPPAAVLTGRAAWPLPFPEHTRPTEGGQP